MSCGCCSMCCRPAQHRSLTAILPLLLTLLSQLHPRVLLTACSPMYQAVLVVHDVTCSCRVHRRCLSVLCAGCLTGWTYYFCSWVWLALHSSLAFKQFTSCTSFSGTECPTLELLISASVRLTLTEEKGPGLCNSCCKSSAGVNLHCMPAAYLGFRV